MPERSKRLHNRKALKARRRQLRNQGTPAEATLWRLLSHRKLAGRKFRRQHSVGPYVLDFYCPAERFAVELDGAVHDDPARHDYDTTRCAYLTRLGIQVVRFENRAVYEDPDRVLQTIAHFFGNR